MNAVELGKTTREFNREMLDVRAVREPPGKRARLERALGELREQRTGERPRVGREAQRVVVTVERKLLRRADRFAKRYGLSRAQLIAKGLEMVIRKKAG